MVERRSSAGQAARRAFALRLRVMGFRYTDIAEAVFPAFGDGPLFPNAAMARKAVAAALADAVDDIETERRLQAQRLDLLLTGGWGKALGGDGPGVDRQLAIESRRARLLALDLPDSAGVPEAAATQAAAAVEVADKLQRYVDALARAGTNGTAGANGAHGANGGPPLGETLSVGEARA